VAPTASTRPRTDYLRGCSRQGRLAGSVTDSSGCAAPGAPLISADILSPFGISPGHDRVLRLRHVADVRFWARLRAQKRSDKGTDAGHVGDIASGASWTPLKITRPLRSSKVRRATSETPQSGLEISPATCALLPHGHHGPLPPGRNSQVARRPALNHHQRKPTAPGHPTPAGAGVYLVKSTDPWPGLRRSSRTDSNK
jgi:hypothetical protein